jgi:transcriptional regulator with XRE-family HTH domain
MSTDQQDVLIGARLRSLRKIAGLSQTQVGDALGVTFQQVQKYENGKNRLSGSRLITVCRTLKTTPDALLGTKSKASNGQVEDVVDLLNDPTIRKALHALQKLRQPQRTHAIRAFVELVQVLV